MGKRLAAVAAALAGLGLGGAALAQDMGPCQEVVGQAEIGGVLQTISGVACLQPDGTWQLVDSSGGYAGSYYYDPWYYGGYGAVIFVDHFHHHHVMHHLFFPHRGVIVHGGGFHGGGFHGGGFHGGSQGGFHGGGGMHH